MSRRPRKSSAPKSPPKKEGGGECVSAAVEARIQARMSEAERGSRADLVQRFEARGVNLDDMEC